METNLTRKQANDKAQRLANETGQRHFVWSLPTWDSSSNKHYRVVSERAASLFQRLQTVAIREQKEA